MKFAPLAPDDRRRRAPTPPATIAFHDGEGLRAGADRNRAGRRADNIRGARSPEPRRPLWIEWADPFGARPSIEFPQLQRCHPLKDELIVVEAKLKGIAGGKVSAQPDLAGGDRAADEDLRQAIADVGDRRRHSAVADDRVGIGAAGSLPLHRGCGRVLAFDAGDRQRVADRLDIHDAAGDEGRLPACVVADDGGRVFLQLDRADAVGRERAHAKPSFGSLEAVSAALISFSVVAAFSAALMARCSRVRQGGSKLLALSARRGRSGTARQGRSVRRCDRSL